MASGEVQSLSRAFAILDCFSYEHPQLGVREIARQLGMSASTVGRILAAFNAAGILNQDPSTRLYRMGPKVMMWSAVYTKGLDVREYALPVLKELHRLTNETVSLYVLERDERVCVACIESSEIVRVVVRVGERMPLHAGSAGKTLLAFMPPIDAETVIAKPLGKMTAHTITAKSDLLAELETIRKQGYATSNSERFEDVIGLAAPVFDASGKVFAALNVAGPKTRFTASRAERIAPSIVRLADEVSFNLGYGGARKSSAGV